VAAAGWLAIAIGANTSIFSLYGALVLRQLAAGDAGKLARATAMDERGLVHMVWPERFAGAGDSGSGGPGGVPVFRLPPGTAGDAG
jgi:hypothetical protein